MTLDEIPVLYEGDDCRLCREAKRTLPHGASVQRVVVRTSRWAYRLCPICDVNPREAIDHLVAGRKWF